ncbi:MAG: tyrosine-type recombinase/integrase [Oceanicaulis sp.]
MNLTANFVETVRPDPDRQRDFPDAGRSGVPGLALRVSPGGKKSWTLRYRTLGGTQRRISLGAYPKVGLAKARMDARAALAARDEGQDPAQTQKDRRVEQKVAEANTVQSVWERYKADALLGRHKKTRSPKPKRQSTMDHDEVWARNHVLPWFGDRPVSSITADDIDEMTLELLETGVPSRARGSYVVIRQLLSYCRFKGLIGANPIDQTTPPENPKPRRRILTDEEFQLLWSALETKAAGGRLDSRLADDQDEPAIAPGTALALLLCATTLQRRSEIAGLMTAEIQSVDQDGGTWLIPGDRTKNGHDHIVPLSKLSSQLIRDALHLRETDTPIQHGDSSQTWSLKPNRPLFPSPLDPEKPITSDALSRAMAKLNEALGIKPVAKAHDLRRTGSTRMTERLGVPRFVVSQVLNHRDSRTGGAEVTQVYDLYDYLAEKRDALVRWGGEISRIVGTAGDQ